MIGAVALTILWSLGWVAAAIWLWRMVLGIRAFQSAPRISTQPAPPDAPLATILVPARNEEMNIEPCIRSLLGQKYPRFEVVAVDDNSTDRTGEILRALAAAEERLAVLSTPPTPAGWTGKNHALALAAGRARGEWLLFTDADTRHEPYALPSAIGFAVENRLDLLSLSPRAIAGNWIERILQPPALGLLALWFPIDRINDPADPLGYANGQFLLMRRSAYDALGGHEAVRERFLEDVAFARAAKRKGLKLAVTFGRRLFGVRMYDTLPRYCYGWKRIYLHSYDRRPLVLAGKGLDVTICMLLPALTVVLTAASGAWSLEAIGATVSTVIHLLYAAKVNSTFGESRVFALFHPLAAVVLVGILLGALKDAVTGAPTRWR